MISLEVNIPVGDPENVLCLSYSHLSYVLICICQQITFSILDRIFHLSLELNYSQKPHKWFIQRGVTWTLVPEDNINNIPDSRCTCFTRVFKRKIVLSIFINWTFVKDFSIRGLKTKINSFTIHRFANEIMFFRNNSENFSTASCENIHPQKIDNEQNTGR